MSKKKKKKDKPLDFIDLCCQQFNDLKDDLLSFLPKESKKDKKKRKERERQRHYKESEELLSCASDPDAARDWGNKPDNIENHLP